MNIEDEPRKRFAMDAVDLGLGLVWAVIIFSLIVWGLHQL